MLWLDECVELSMRAVLFVSLDQDAAAVVVFGREGVTHTHSKRTCTVSTSILARVVDMHDTFLRQAVGRPSYLVFASSLFLPLLSVWL
jgi:hypothetical protein